MCTSKRYVNFILEFEFKVPEGMNSGVQFRSQSTPQTPKWRSPVKRRNSPPTGCTATNSKSNPSPRAFTAGVYDEARRGWLFDLKSNEAARKTHQGWRVELWPRVENAVAIPIKTFLNGVAAADLKDGLTPKGLIALQVHGIGKNAEAAGKEIRWRNIRIQELP